MAWKSLIGNILSFWEIRNSGAGTRTPESILGLFHKLFGHTKNRPIIFIINQIRVSLALISFRDFCPILTPFGHKLATNEGGRLDTGLCFAAIPGSNAITGSTSQPAGRTQEDVDNQADRGADPSG